MEKNISRRQFIRELAGTGALVAVSSLPALAQELEVEDRLGLFGKRERHERLGLSCSVVEIGLEHPFSVMHISDVHLAEAYPHESETKIYLKKRRNVTFGGLQELALRDSLAWARENVDYIVLTGDLIDWQSEANFDLVRKYFGEGMTGSMGNHEFSPDMWLGDIKEQHTEEYKDLSRERLAKVFPFDLQFCSQIVNGVNFITIDNVYGYVVQSQVDRFKAEAAKGLPIVLCMHVPFYTDTLWRINRRFWDLAGKKYTDSVLPEVAGEYQVQREDPVTRDFIAYLKEEPLLKAILAGHLHFNAEVPFSPSATEYLVGGNFLFQAREILFV